MTTPVRQWIWKGVLDEHTCDRCRRYIGGVIEKRDASKIDHLCTRGACRCWLELVRADSETTIDARTGASGAKS